MIVADTDSNALTKHVGPLPVWVWMALVFVAAMIFSYVKRGAGGGDIDPQTGLVKGSAGDAKALSSLQQLQNAASRSGASGGGAQTPPTIIQNYPASTQITTAFPLHGSAFGNNGSPSWPIKGHHPHRARKGGPGPQGPGHKPWEHGDHGWNGGEPHHDGGGPGAGEHHERHDHQGDGGHHGDHDDHGGRPGWGGGQDHGGGWGGGHGGGGGDHDDHGHGGGGGGHGRGGHGH